MTIKTFRKKLVELIEDGDFVTDGIDMRGLKRAARREGRDIDQKLTDVVLVSGMNSDEVFLLTIQKII